MAIATGQFTIIDYNDALTLTGYIGSNHPKTQMYNPDTGGYTPDWTSSNLVLTPSLYKLGTVTDIITDTAVTSVQWYSVSSGTETLITADANHVYSGAKSHILTIKVNELAGLPAKDYVCKITYHDPSTNLDLIHKLPISFSRVVNGGGIADAIAWCPQGNVFKNESVSTLTAQCDLWRGSVIDTTSVTYRWFRQDANIFVPTTTTTGSTTTAIICNSVAGMNVGESVIVGAESAKVISAINTGTKTITLASALTSAPASGVAVKHADYDADAGSGWRKISSDIASNITGVTTNTITVYDAYVVNYSVFMCLIKDTDAGSNTYNNVFKDTVTIVDQSDLIQVSIASTGGDVFKNGVGSTTLTAKLYRAGVELDAGGSAYTYTWTIFDKDGNVTTFNGGASTKTGKSITVGDADVSVKSTFAVSIS